MTKRGVDLLFAVLVSLFALPVVLVAAACICLESRGSPLFVQERVGRHEKRFRCYKLRTMRLGTGDRGSHEVEAEAITKIGRLLRRTKLDEVPQVVNVFRNEMSFVGPRPGLPVQADLTHARRAKRVHEVLPGITNWARAGSGNRHVDAGGAGTG